MGPVEKPLSSEDGCTNWAVSGRVCRSHGAETKCCSEDCCTKWAVIVTVPRSHSAANMAVQSGWYLAEFAVVTVARGRSSMVELLGPKEIHCLFFLLDFITVELSCDNEALLSCTRASAAEFPPLILTW